MARNNDTLPRTYYNYIKKHPLLTAEQEHYLFKRLAALTKIAQDSPTHALAEQIAHLKQIIISANLRLVVSIAKHYVNRGIAIPDLIDEGTIGLIEATRRFNYRKGNRFSTYATWWIKQSIVQALGNQSNSVRIPTYLLNVINRQGLVYNDLAQRLGREPSLKEISAQMSISEGRLQNIVNMHKTSSSLDKSQQEDGENTMERVADEHSLALLNRDLEIHIVPHIIDHLLDSLSERETMVLQLRYGLNGYPRLTLEETCAHVGLTRERVRQIQKRAIEKLRVYSTHIGLMEAV